MNIDPSYQVAELGLIPSAVKMIAEVDDVAIIGLERGVVALVAKAGSVGTLDLARRVHDTVVAAVSGPHEFVLFADRFIEQTPESRRFWSREGNPQVFAGWSFIARSPLARAMAAFASGISRPPVPTTVHADLAGALAAARGRRDRS